MIYDKTFDYDDMKIAMEVQSFYNAYENEMKDYETYEDLIDLCIAIREDWNKLSPSASADEDYGYSQCYAEHWLANKFLGLEE